MNWTTETPNKPGWYYYQRLPEGNRTFPIRCAYFAPHFFPYTRRHEVSCFAGPLPEPEAE